MERIVKRRREKYKWIKRYLKSWKHKSPHLLSDFRRQFLRSGEEVAMRPFQSADGGQPRSVADADGVGAPGRCETQPKKTNSNKKTRGDYQESNNPCEKMLSLTLNINLATKIDYTILQNLKTKFCIPKKIKSTCQSPWKYLGPISTMVCFDGASTASWERWWRSMPFAQWSPKMPQRRHAPSLPKTPSRSSELLGEDLGIRGMSLFQ